MATTQGTFSSLTSARSLLTSKLRAWAAWNSASLDDGRTLAKCACPNLIINEAVVRNPITMLPRRQTWEEIASSHVGIPGGILMANTRTNGEHTHSEGRIAKAEIIRSSPG